MVVVSPVISISIVAVLTISVVYLFKQIKLYFDNRLVEEAKRIKMIYLVYTVAFAVSSLIWLAVSGFKLLCKDKDRDCDKSLDF